MICSAGFPATFERPVILTREEARAKLHTLKPETPEYSQIENALLKTNSIVEIILPDVSYKVSTTENCLRGGFGSGEHMAIGHAVNLPEVEKDAALIIRGLGKATFFHILALAGDFYGVYGAAISLPGGSDEDKRTRFMDAFATLEGADNNQLKTIIREIDEEHAAMQRSCLPHHCYSHGMMGKNKAINKIKEDTQKLLIDNSDHFGDNAKEAYRIVHTLALEEAAKAGTDKDLMGLNDSLVSECSFYLLFN